MGWPVNAVYEARVAGTTTIKAAWGDATDAAFNGLYGGTRTIYGLHLDGTGYAAKAAIARTIKAWGGNLILTTDNTGTQFVYVTGPFHATGAAGFDSTVAITGNEQAVKHLCSSGAPSVSIGTNAGAGGGGSAALAGTDEQGTITIVSGGAPTSGRIADINLSITLPQAPDGITIVPANAAAWALGSTIQAVSSNIIAASWSMNNAGAGALAATTTYKWTYTVLGKP